MIIGKTFREFEIPNTLSYAHVLNYIYKNSIMVVLKAVRTFYVYVYHNGTHYTVAFIINSLFTIVKYE